MAYRNASGWDDSGNDVYVKLRPGDTYRHAGIEYANDGWPISGSRDGHSATRPHTRPKAGDANRPTQTPRRPEPESQANGQASGGLRELFEERYGPPPPRPRYTEEDELREFYARRSAQIAREQSGTSSSRGRQPWPSAFESLCEQMESSYPRENFSGHARRDSTHSRYSNLDNGGRYTPPPASRTYRRDPLPGSYNYYLEDNVYHDRAHTRGLIEETHNRYSLRELREYREYDEYYYSGMRRSPIHGSEGRYGDHLRHERYISEIPRTSNTHGRRPFSPPLRSSDIPPARRPFSSPRDTGYSTSRQPFSSSSPSLRPLTSDWSAAWKARFPEDDRDTRLPKDAFEARFGKSEFEYRFGKSEFDYRFRNDDLDAPRHDPRDPCRDPSVHIGKPGKCFARRDAGYYV